MKLFAAAAVAIALASSGCAALAPATGAPGAGQFQKIDAQALGAAYAAGSAANVMITAAARSGLMTPTQATTLQGVRAKMDAGLKAAQAAYDVGDAATYQSQITAVISAANEATAFVKGFMK